MKTSITFFLFLLFFNTLISQNKSKELKEAFDTEIYNFNNRVLNTYKGGVIAYNKLDDILKEGEERKLNSRGEYSKLVPGWFGVALKVADKVVPGSEKIGKVATGLLEIGWKEHNDEIEALRKKTAVDGQIDVRTLVNNWKVEFELRMSRFIRNDNFVSKFEKRNKEIFNLGTLKEKEQILKELQDYNKQLVKDYPHFAENNNEKARKIAQIGVYEAYINHFTKEQFDELNIGGQGYLMVYLNYDENINLIDTVIIPKVASGIEVGHELNELLAIDKKLLELDVHKVIFAHIKGKPVLNLTIFPDNYIAYTLINEKNSECTKYKQDVYGKSKFLSNSRVGIASLDKCGLWYIKKSSFKEFTERNSSTIKKLPNTLKKQLDF